MTETSADPGRAELEDLLNRLEQSKLSLVQALEKADPKKFDQRNGDESVKQLLDRTTDELNFYYGRLVARALNLPQPPCLTKSDLGSLREVTMALQVAHRRFTNLLHDLIPDDMAKVAQDAELGSYTLRQLLEMTAAQYTMRANQVQRLAGG